MKNHVRSVSALCPLCVRHCEKFRGILIVWNIIPDTLGRRIIGGLFLFRPSIPKTQHVMGSREGQIMRVLRTSFLPRPDRRMDGTRAHAGRAMVRSAGIFLLGGKMDMKNEKKKALQLPANFAGWISVRHRIIWSVNPWRKDKRTGVVRS